MIPLPHYVEELREERRKLNIYVQQLGRSVKRQKEITKEIEEKNTDLQRTKRELERENKKLRDELERARVTIETYKQMLFDKHQHAEVAEDKNLEQEVKE